jgi:hypothetical protein
MLLLMLLASGIYFQKRARWEPLAWALDWKRAAALACLTLAVSGCGGGSGSSVQQPPPVITPTGIYNLTVAPSATPIGSPTNYLLCPSSLTLVVK